MDKDTGGILIYQNEKGDTQIDVYFANDDIWLTQKALSELFQVGIPTINEHIKHILDDGELNENSTIRNFRIVRNEGQRQVERLVLHYNFQYDTNRHLQATTVEELVQKAKQIEKAK